MFCHLGFPRSPSSSLIACVITEVRSADLKIILLGDSAVGKSKLVERFLMDQYKPRQLSTYGRWPGGVVVRQCWCWCCCTQCDLGVVPCAIARVVGVGSGLVLNSQACWWEWDAACCRYALTVFRYDTTVDGRDISIDFWDTAGQGTAVASSLAS